MNNVNLHELLSSISIEADWIGLQILKSSGMQSAVELHMEEFKERYGVESSEIDSV